MTVKELIEELKKWPEDAQVCMDDDTYPKITGCGIPDGFDGDEEDAPPRNTVLLET